MKALGKVVYVQKKGEDNAVRHFFVLDTGLACTFRTNRPLKLKNRTVEVEGVPYRDRNGRIILAVRSLSFTNKEAKGKIYVEGKIVKRFLSYSDGDKTREFLLIEEKESGRKVPVEAWNAPSGKYLSIAGGHIVKATEAKT